MYQPVEKRSRRTLNSKAFRLNAQGTLLRGEYHCGHIHFKDVLGRFGGGMEDIDPRLVDSSAHAWTMERAGYWAMVRKVFNAPGSLLYRAYGDEFQLSLQPLDLWWVDAGGNPLARIAGPQPVTGKLGGANGFGADQTVVYEQAFGKGIHCRVQARRSALVREIVVDDLAALGRRPENAAFLAIPFEAEGLEGLTIRRDKQIWNKKTDLLVDMDSPWEIEQRTDCKAFMRPMVARESGERGLAWPLKMLWRKRDNRLGFVKLVPISILEKASFPLVIDDSVSYTVGPGDGYVGNDGTTYATVRGAADGNNADYTAQTMNMGQYLSGSTYYVWRVFLPFDTSGLPDGDVISAATLHQYCEGDRSTVDFNFALVEATQASPSQLVVGDFSKCGDLSNPTLWSSVVNTADVTASTWIEIGLNAAGRAGINKTGWTKIGIRSEEDYANSGSPPTGYEYLQLTSSTWAANAPYLSITYSAPAAAQKRGYAFLN